MWLCLLLTCAAGQNIAIAQQGHDELTAEKVREAINKGVAYLEGQQKGDGSWEDYPGNPGGTCALCTLALLNAGVEPWDPNIQRALAYLRILKAEDWQKTYVASLQTMVFVRAVPQTDIFLIKRNAKWLEATQIGEGPYKGAWTYQGNSGFGDNSNSQFALLALHEAENAGVHVNDQTWRLARTYWEKCQNKDGSWGYHLRNPGRGSMTCAGITSLVITSDRIAQPDAKTSGKEIICCAEGDNRDMDPVEHGLYWLGKHFSVTQNPGSPGGLWWLYYLYGMERTGRLTARRFIGNADWYREGAQYLIQSQDPLSGFWSSRATSEESRLVGTSFALLFLSKGRWPVLISKLKHPPDDDWNKHRHDLDNLTRFVESHWKKNLTWQDIDLQSARVEDLLQSPVLFFCGSSNPLPAAPEKSKAIVEKLRDYLDRGGFIFAEAYCGEGGFDKAFRELISRVFPEKEYRLRLLEPEHPIWHADKIIPPDQLRPLWGVDFGCRTSVVYAPLDPPGKPRPSLSCLWELARGGRMKKYSPSVQARINAALDLGINVLAYATNRELRPKEEFFQTTFSQQAKNTFKRGQLDIAQVRHPGACNSAPRALKNLLESIGRELNIRASAPDRLIDLGDKAIFDYHLLYMQGRTAFRLTDEERAHLKEYLQRGGMLFADSICASQ
ncbi:MAG: DUF4159 domain-containing protein, partial [Thermoguttaceae bacterium]